MATKPSCPECGFYLPNHAPYVLQATGKLCSNAPPQPPPSTLCAGGCGKDMGRIGIICGECFAPLKAMFTCLKCGLPSEDCKCDLTISATGLKYLS